MAKSLAGGGFLSIRELSEEIGVPVNTIYAWRARGEGPTAVRLGKALRFRVSDVERWLEEQADGPREAVGGRA